ncbi:MAG: Rrf2 family transcriptional regulator, partial [Psychromonas sp.]
DKDNLVECFGDNNHCVITPSCQLKGIFAEAQESFFKTLDKYTLNDLVAADQQQALGALLSSGASSVEIFRQ